MSIPDGVVKNRAWSRPVAASTVRQEEKKERGGKEGLCINACMCLYFCPVPRRKGACDDALYFICAVVNIMSSVTSGTADCGYFELGRGGRRLSCCRWVGSAFCAWQLLVLKIRRFGEFSKWTTACLAGCQHGPVSWNAEAVAGGKGSNSPTGVRAGLWSVCLTELPF
eukprot:evm.model.scf_2077.2 EVM.evm.TU.scf_2077.2   scf_2077:25287-25790(-)